MAAPPSGGTWYSPLGHSSIPAHWAARADRVILIAGLGEGGGECSLSAEAYTSERPFPNQGNNLRRQERPPLSCC